MSMPASRAITGRWSSAPADKRLADPAGRRPSGRHERRWGRPADQRAAARARHPHHYAFTSGWLGDRIVTRSDRDPLHYRDAAARLAPETTVRIVEPGTRVEL
jgi:hypothetical protein